MLQRQRVEFVDSAMESGLAVIKGFEWDRDERCGGFSSKLRGPVDIEFDPDIRDEDGDLLFTIVGVEDCQASWWVTAENLRAAGLEVPA